MHQSKLTNYFTLLISTLLLSACATTQKGGNPYSHIKDQKVVDILKKSYATLGGLENWENIQELHYDKQSTLLLESGTVENASFQYHDYFYNKNEIKIAWDSEDGSKHELLAKEGKPAKYIDGKMDPSAKTEALQNSITISLFVIGVPFKMMDQGVTLSYAGSDVLEDGQKVEIVKAVYDPENHAHHTTPDIWWYYFDNQDFRLVGYMVKHADHFSYVKNTAYDKVGSFIVPKSRISYRVDEQRNILYTRAKYTYDNWLVKER